VGQRLLQSRICHSQLSHVDVDSFRGRTQQTASVAILESNIKCIP
jgi:hypothetical protein